MSVTLRAGSSLPDVVISTAHKSKGRQWESVQISPDFTQDKRAARDGKVEPPSREDLMLCYLSMTSA